MAIPEAEIQACEIDEKFKFCSVKKWKKFLDSDPGPDHSQTLIDSLLPQGLRLTKIVYK